MKKNIKTIAAVEWERQGENITKEKRKWENSFVINSYCGSTGIYFMYMAYMESFEKINGHWQKPILSFNILV